MIVRRPNLALASMLVATTALASGNDKLLRQLSSQLSEPDPEARIAAAKALSEFRPLYRGVVLSLMDRLADHDERVRTAAQEALRSMSELPDFGKVAKGLSRPPKVISIERAPYPAEALARGLSGEVMLEIQVAADGTVARVQAIEPVEGLTEAAIAAAQRWRFVPAVRDGRLVATPARAPVTFRAPRGPVAAATVANAPLMVSFAELKWTTQAERPNMQSAVLSGDPRVGPYTQMRRVPAGTDDGPHAYGSETTNVIISGVWYTGTDEASARDFGPGSVVRVPAGWVHVSGCRAGNECVFYQYGNGQFDFRPAPTPGN